MQTLVPKGRANYEPNSLADAGEPGGPRESELGFGTYPAPVSGTKLRVRAETFADHYSEARLFYRSQSEIEQAHLRAALVFELSKVTLPHIRERVLSNLANVDVDLATRAAEALGMPVPSASAPAAPVIEMKPARSLRLLDKYPAAPAGRMIGILATDGADGATIEGIRAAAQKGGAFVKIISPRIGGVTLKGGAHLSAEGQLAGSPSAFFDAIALVLSKPGCAALLKESAAVDFVSDAYSHLKAIAYSPEAKPLLERAGVSPDEGVFGVGDPGRIAQNAATRYFSREQSVRMLP